MIRSQGIIFDFNGVVVLDAEITKESWQRFAEYIRKQRMPEDEWNQLYGHTTYYMIQHLLGRRALEAELDRLEIQKEEMYLELCHHLGADFTLSPGSEKLFDQLAEADIPRAIATSSIKMLVDFYWDHFNLKRWFERKNMIFWDHSFEGKPAPDIYRRAARALEQEPSELIAVEDSIPGIVSASGAGITWVIAMGPRESHEKLMKAGADLAIESLTELHPEGLF